MKYFTKCFKRLKYILVAKLFVSAWNECVASQYPTYIMHYRAASQYYRVRHKKTTPYEKFNFSETM